MRYYNNEGKLVGGQDDAVSVWNWIGFLFLCFIPLINVVAMIFFASYRGINASMANCARAMLVLPLILVMLFLMVFRYYL